MGKSDKHVACSYCGQPRRKVFGPCIITPMRDSGQGLVLPSRKYTTICGCFMEERIIKGFRLADLEIPNLVDTRQAQNDPFKKESIYSIVERLNALQKRVDELERLHRAYREPQPGPLRVHPGTQRIMPCS